MERLLLLWDELDDLAGACRHVAASAAEEVASIAAPLAAFASTLGVGLLTLHSHAHTVLPVGLSSPYWML